MSFASAKRFGICCAWRSSLDSMVVGEPQILGQVKESWSVAREVGAISSTEFSSMLDPLAAAGVLGCETRADGDADRQLVGLDCVGGGGAGAQDLRIAGE